MIASVPSASTLAKRYREWLKTNMTPEDREATESICSSLNLDALKVAASRALGDSCTGTFFIGQGGFNLIYILTFEHVPDVIARINGSYSNQDHEQSDEMIARRISSEAATLEYVRQNTTIPVPKVFAVETNPRNAVNTRYMLQERILGQSLVDVWSSLSANQMDVAVSRVAQLEGQLYQTRFSAIGSLEKQANGQVQVGPLGLSCMRVYNLRQDRGPWISSLDWLKAYAAAELDLLENAPYEWACLRSVVHSDGGAKSWQSTQLLEYFKTYYHLFLVGINGLRGVLPGCYWDNSEMPFVLFHEDISLSNVMVAYDDPTRVIGIVDWEGACVVPLWACCAQDRLIEIDDERLLGLRHLHDSILEHMEPKIATARAPSFPFSYLRFMVSSWGSTQWSVETSKDLARTFLRLCSEEQARPFKAFLDFVNDGPSACG